MDSNSTVGFRLSPLQEQFWSTPALRSAHVAARIAVDGALDAARLRQCFVDVVGRHESLRTSFQQSRGYSQPFQVVREQPACNWELVDLTQRDATSQQAIILERLATHGGNDSAVAEPEMQITLFQTGTNRHAMVVRAPALCCDASSLLAAIGEAIQLYRNQTPAEPGVQYVDYSEWHNELLGTASEEGTAGQSFWSGQNLHAPVPPLGRSAAGAGKSQSTHPVDISALPLPRTAAACARMLLGCWQVLLWRMSRQESNVVDVISSGRALEDLRHSVGLFSRPLPITLRLQEGMTFQATLDQLASATSEAEKWQLHAPRISNGNVGFEFNQLPAIAPAEGTAFAFEQCASPPWPFSLSLRCSWHEQGPTLELCHDDSLYGAADAARIASYFVQTVLAATRNAEATIGAFDPLGAAERNEILARSCAQSVPTTDARCFHELFEAQVALTPDREALTFEGAALSYTQLNERANRIAHWLQENGAGPGVPVGLCLERSGDMIIALLAVAKSGSAYVPLLPDLPPARMAHQLRETSLALLISTQPLAASLPDYTGKVVYLDRDQSVLANMSTANPVSRVSTEDAIYILYTSGSTGLPKGVIVRHGNITNYVRGISQRLGLNMLSSDPGFRFATVSTLAADLGNTSIFTPLVTGGSVAVIGSDVALDGALYARSNQSAPIDFLKITPSNLHALMATAPLKQVLPRVTLIVGGEACTWELARQVMDAGTCTLLNHYGPTETTIGCLAYNVSTGDPQLRARTAAAPLGKPFPNTQVYVLDHHLRPLPDGVAGEICVGGAGVSSGYLARAAETGQRFVKHPFLATERSLYRTGDLGRMLPDGNIEFLGRVDDQVKIRGQRVELGEVESLLRQCPGVTQAAVILAGDKLNPHLSAFLVANPAIQADDLRRQLRTHLPDYMVPYEITCVDKLPLNANGKVDRHQLLEIKTTAALPKVASIAPRNALEEQLLDIWRQVLNRADFGVRDDFFDLGGHSLLATMIIARIRANLKLNASIRMLFESPTIEMLAGAIGTLADTDEAEMGFDQSLEGLEGLADRASDDDAGHSVK